MGLAALDRRELAGAQRAPLLEHLDRGPQIRDLAAKPRIPSWY